ncbi:MAG: amino acid adenylation protein [Desmonostoc vinosum HA7617-LM4]|nr:amino acid adenylation protein [Desmonostoc vinosum HA7617-LM4]
MTSLEWYSNKYPEIAERCNNALLNLIHKQATGTLTFANTGYSENDLDAF